MTDMDRDLLKDIKKLEIKLQDLKVATRDVDDFKIIKHYRKDIIFFEKEIKDLKELRKLTDYKY